MNEGILDWNCAARHSCRMMKIATPSLKLDLVWVENSDVRQGRYESRVRMGMGQKPPREGATSGFKLPRRVHTSPALCIFFFDELKDSGTKTSPHSIRINLSPTKCRSVLGLTILLVLPPIPTPQPPKMRPQRPLPSFKHRPKLLPLRPIHPRSRRRYRQSSAHPMSSQQLEPNSPIPLK